MVTGTLITDILLKKFSQTKFGTDRELALQEQRERTSADVQNLHLFRRNPKGVRRVRVAL